MYVKIDPVPKPRMTQRDRWAQRPAVMRYRAFCDELRLLVKEPPAETLSLVFYLPMPKSWSRKKRDEMLLAHHQQRPDIDNLVKGVMDALYEDDAVVWYISAKKFWSNEGGIEIDVA